MQAYVIKWSQEAIWAVVVAAAAAVAAVIAGVPVDQLLSEPKAVVALIVAAVGRAAGAVIYNQLQKLVGGSE